MAAVSQWVAPPAVLVLGSALRLLFPELPSAQTARWTKVLLQASVVALGFGVNLGQLAAADRSGLIYMAFGIVTTLMSGMLLGIALGVESTAAFLISTGTTICRSPGGTADESRGRRQVGRSLIQGATMKASLTCVLMLLPLIGGVAQVGSAVRCDKTFTVESYYKVQWGHQQEFLQLYLKNYYPLLRRDIEVGRIVAVSITTPTDHMSEESRWDYRVTVWFKSPADAAAPNPQEESWIAQLWPDRERYKREEQRRFEILLAHWDIPVRDITPSGAH